MVDHYPHAISLPTSLWGRISSWETFVWNNCKTTSTELLYRKSSYFLAIKSGSSRFERDLDNTNLTEKEKKGWRYVMKDMRLVYGLKSHQS
jgi:hypothetical protein